MRRINIMLGCVALCTVGGSAWGVAGPWVNFTNQTSTRLVAAPSLGASDTQEKAFAWGDFDHDGDVDLVVARKQPFTTSGPRPNVLLMNENGVLTDRSTEYASESTVVSDQGFLTPTNDRDVMVGDFNADGWLDIVTAPTLSSGQPTHISHPRIYINKGSVGGVWQGFRYEANRIPTFPMVPNFCSVGVGDVTGDGSLDLYFADYSSFVGSPDLNDRLLINDGAGFFTDQTAIRMSSQMTASGFGHSAAIADMNGDGKKDIIKGTALGEVDTRISTSYNGPTTGIFPSQNFQISSTGSTYFFSVGDLNNDGRMDMIVTDDGSDHYHLNQGNGANGQVIWNSLTVPSSGSIGGNTVIADLNNDGWLDFILTGNDVDFSGCRPGNVYKNNGNPPNITFSVANGGIPQSFVDGNHDAAMFDINGDGWKDIVFGNCSGLTIWINQPPCVAADLNCDGAVNGLDIGILLSQWLTDGSADLNNDNIVDGLDIGVMLAAWTG